MTAASPTPAAKTTAARKPRAPKAPADRKAPAVLYKNTPAGKLMKPLSDIPLHEQRPIIKLTRKYQNVEEQTEGMGDEEAIDFMIDTIFEVANEMRAYAVDQDAFDEYLKGMGALDRAKDLMEAWLGHAGK